MLKLKENYRTFREQHRQEITELEQEFYKDDHAYLRGTRLPERLKETARKLWSDSPLSKITEGWGRNILSLELEDLKQDNVCKHNTNKEYWLMSYMLDWLNSLPEEATAEYLMANIYRRDAWRKLIQDAYEEVKEEGVKKCPDCTNELVEGEDSDGKFLYCPNEMCLNQEQHYLNQEVK